MFYEVGGEVGGCGGAEFGLGGSRRRLTTNLQTKRAATMSTINTPPPTLAARTALIGWGAGDGVALGVEVGVGDGVAAAALVTGVTVGLASTEGAADGDGVGVLLAALPVGLGVGVAVGGGVGVGAAGTVMVPEPFMQPVLGQVP